MTAISFGDRVQIRSTVLTQELGLAGRIGMVHGSTTPSITGVSVIGLPTSDYALAVALEGDPEATWFEPGLVEFVDHAPGTTVKLADRTFTRSPEGEWKENG